MKLISYCLYGEHKYYRNGLLANLKLANDLFPDWILRVYVDSSHSYDDFVSYLRCNFEVDIIRMKERFPGDGVHWRMLPLQENHDAVIVRDVDTRLSSRDVALVNDWLNSGFKYHICRDESGHKAPIMAGIWGARSPKLQISKLWKDHYLPFSKSSTRYNAGKGNDQSFLARKIYPLIIDEAVIYSEFNFYVGEKNLRKIPERIGFNQDGLFNSIGTRVIADIVEEDSDEFSKIRINESGPDAVGWFNSRYLSSHIVIRYPRYRYKSKIKSAICYAFFLYCDGGWRRLISPFLRKFNSLNDRENQ